MGFINELILFLQAYFLSLIGLYVIMKVSHKFAWYDVVDERKIHKGSIPRTGGMAIFWSFSIVLLINSVFVLGKGIKIDLFLDAKMIILVIGAVVFHFIGVFDDFKDLRARHKFFTQLLMASLIFYSGTSFKIEGFDFAIPLRNFLSYILTVGWIVGVANAINIIDGMDGLSSVISLAAVISISLLANLSSMYLLLFICVALGGSILAFFTLNAPPAKIFMGDSGSLFIGYCLAVFLLWLLGRNDSVGILSGINILIIPISDTVFSILRRLKTKKHIARPDREHLHHMLLDLGYGPRTILFGVGGYCFINILAMIYKYKYISRVSLRFFLDFAGVLVAIMLLSIIRMNWIKKKKHSVNVEQSIMEAVG